MTSIIEQQVAPSGHRWATPGSSGVVGQGRLGGVPRWYKAVGAQLTCVFVDTGLLRQGEGEQVVDTFRRHQHIELIHVRRSADCRCFERLAGVTDPEDKRKIIGELFDLASSRSRPGARGTDSWCRARCTPTSHPRVGQERRRLDHQGRHNVGAAACRT